MSKQKPEVDKDIIKNSWAMTRMLIVSMIVLKTLFFYFGLKYSEYPGEGYGYGLAISAFLSIANIGYFFWKIKDIEFD